MKYIGPALIVLFLFTVACTRKSTETYTAPAHTASIDPTTVGTITGVVKFDGTPPNPQRIDMTQDPACGSQPAFDDSVLVADGKLANVFIYVKDGLSDLRFDPPAAPVNITQKGCRYQPHVTAALVGQAVNFDNADQTTHNMHMMPRKLHQWNESQMPGAPPIEKHFDHPEIMIPIQCNQHPWMHMYFSVVSHPFFAVTDKAGKFEIHGLPPGTYTVAAVHERLGEQDMKVTVSPKESKSIDFTFKSEP